MGTNTLSSSGDAANWHWQQVALKGHVENCGVEEKALNPLETPAKWTEGRTGRWGVDNWKLLPIQLPALNFSQYPHHYSNLMILQAIQCSSMSHTEKKQTNKTKTNQPTTTTKPQKNKAHLHAK